MATMESLIGLVNRIQRACTVLGDHGGDTALPTLWEALPSVVVVGGQVCIVECYSILIFLFFDVNVIVSGFSLSLSIFLFVCIYLRTMKDAFLR